jgi:hypothetical protein
MYLMSKTLLVAGSLVCAICTSGQTLPKPIDAQSQAPPVSADSTTSSSSSTSHNRGWRLNLSPYLWFAGTHGTVGAFGRTGSVHASAGDLLSHMNAGLMGASEAQLGRLLLNGDLLWIRLSDGSALPFPGLTATSVDVRVGQFMWTSKVGYRLIDRPKIKADANVGARYWHLGQKVNLNPSILGVNINRSQSWADIVVGGRIELPFGPKTSITLLGDVGGWNATAKLDYQFASVLSFRVSPKWTVSPGYRYLFVDYRTRNSIYNMVTSGPVIGLTYTIGSTATK